ncbi:MAG TPA: hypothetical protein VEK74_04200 [Burkholderiaceae bacterium]|nr:hypothetical protein [Burkholderiaceae bacterium]
MRVGQPCGWRNTTHLNEGEKSYLRRFRGFWTFAILCAKRISKGFECRRIEQSSFAQRPTAPKLIGSQQTIGALMIGPVRKFRARLKIALRKVSPASSFKRKSTLREARALRAESTAIHDRRFTVGVFFGCAVATI